MHVKKFKGRICMEVFGVYLLSVFTWSFDQWSYYSIDDIECIKVKVIYVGSYGAGQTWIDLESDPGWHKPRWSALSAYSLTFL